MEILLELIEKNFSYVYLDSSIQETLNVMTDYDTVPVLDKEENYKGVVSKLSLYKALHNGTAVDTDCIGWYVTQLSSVLIDDKIETIIRRMQTETVSFIPVCQENSAKLIGVIPTKQVLDLMYNSLGASKEGKSLSVITYDRVGILSKIADFLKKEKVNIITITVVDLDLMGLVEIVLKVDVSNEELQRINSKLEEMGLKIK